MEFAIIMPVVILVLLLAVSVVSIQSSRIQLVSLSAIAAREVSRGATEEEVKVLIRSNSFEPKMELFDSQDFICVDLILTKTIFWLGEIDLTERQCSRKYGL